MRLAVGRLLRFFEEEQFEAAWSDPGAGAALLFELEKQVEDRRATAISILEREKAAFDQSGRCRMWADAGNAAAGRLLQLVRAALPPFLPLEVLPLALSLPVGYASADPWTLLWDCPADNVRGLIVDQSDVDLFVREAAYRFGLKRTVHTACPSFSLRGAKPAEDGNSFGRWAAVELSTKGFAVCRDFLGAEAATTLCELQLGGESEAIQYGHGRAGAGRGDRATLPDVMPTELLTPLDAVVGQLRSACCCRGDAVTEDESARAGSDTTCRVCCAERLELSEFRSWPMDSVYRGSGSRYTWHVDNHKHTNGRVLTCVYYLNRGWRKQDGGVLRLMRRPPQRDAQTHTNVPPQPTEILAEVVPVLDTLVLFWSDLVPHEVLPPTQGERRALSVWYLCPRLGAEQFVLGSPLPINGQTVVEAALRLISRLVDAKEIEITKTETEAETETETADDANPWTSWSHQRSCLADISPDALAWLMAQISQTNAMRKATSDCTTTALREMEREGGERERG